MNYNSTIYTELLNVQLRVLLLMISKIKIWFHVDD